MEFNYYFGASSTLEEARFVRNVEAFFSKDGVITKVDVIGSIVTCVVTLNHSWKRRFSISDLNEVFDRNRTIFRVEDDQIFCQYTLTKRHAVKVDERFYSDADLSKNLVLGVDESGDLTFLPIDRHKLMLVSGSCGSGKTYFLQNAIKKLIYANSSEDLQILAFDMHDSSFDFLKNSRFLYQSKIFKDPREFVEAVKNLDNDKVLIIVEDLEYFHFSKEEDQSNLMKELKESFDRIKNRMILVSQAGLSDSKEFNQMIDSSTFRMIFHLNHIYGSRLSDSLAKTERLNRTGDAFAVDTIRHTVTRIETIVES